DAAEAVDGLGHHARDGGEVGDRAHARHGTAAARFDLGDDGAGEARILSRAVDRRTEVVHDDGGAHPRELDGRRTSDAAAGPGHDGRTAREGHHGLGLYYG